MIILNFYRRARWHTTGIQVGFYYRAMPPIPVQFECSERQEVLFRQGRRGTGARRPSALASTSADFVSIIGPSGCGQDHDLQYHRRPDRTRFRLHALSQRRDRKPARPRRLHDAEGIFCFLGVPCSATCCSGLGEHAASIAMRPEGKSPPIPQGLRPRRLRECLSENIVRRDAPARGVDPHPHYGPRHPVAR